MRKSALRSSVLPMWEIAPAYRKPMHVAVILSIAASLLTRGVSIVGA